MRRRRASLAVRASWTPVAIYYVDPVGGLDTNNGLSPDAAWQTLDKVMATTLTAPSWVLLKGGTTFSGYLLLDAAKHYGSAGKQNVFGSYGGGKAKIQASANNLSGVYLPDAHHVTVRDLIFQGTGTAVSTATGVTAYNNQLGNSKLEGLRLYNLEVYDYGVDGISLWTGGTAYAANSASGWHGAVIEGCVVHDCTGNAPDGNGAGITLQGLYGLNVHPASHTSPLVRGCTVYNCGGKSLTQHSGDGIYLGQCEDATVEYCLAYNNGTNGFAPVGIWMYDCKDSVIQYCVSHSNKTATGATDGGGFDLDGGCNGCILQYNYSVGNEGSGYQLYQFNDVTNLLPLSNNIIRYNISENDGAQDTATKGGIAIGNAENRDQDNNLIYGNTVYSTRDSANGFAIFNGGFESRFTNGGFFNNILVVNGATSKLVNCIGSATPAASFTVQGNLYQATGGVSVKWAATTHATIAAWRAAAGVETASGADTSVSGDPLLLGPLPVGTLTWMTDALLNAYKIGVTSPAVGAGRDPTFDPGYRDFFNNILPSGRLDIGCHQRS